MSFLLRSAFCITAIVLSLPDRAQLPDGVLDRSGMEAARDLCRADLQRCASVVKDGIATLLASDLRTAAVRVRPSADTLRPDDLRHAWVGPAASPGR